MNISQYSNILYKGNINLDFYFYCLKQNKKLIKYFILNIWYYLLSYIIPKKKNIYTQRKFRYLKDIDNLEKTISAFWKQQKTYNPFHIKPDTIMDMIPKILIENKFKKINIIGYELDENYNVNLEKFNDEISQITNAEKLYLTNKYLFSSINSNNIFIVYKNRMKHLKTRKKLNLKLCQLLSLIILSTIITCFSFFFTNSYLDLNMFYSYFEIRLFILNLLPILIAMLLLFLITKRVHISWLITSTIILVFGIANQTKIFYRDDVVKFEDLTLMKEALIMADSCDLVIKLYTIFFIFIIILIYLICRKHLKKTTIKGWKRYSLAIMLLPLSLIGYKNIYTNTEIYNSVGDLSLVNKWIATRQSQIRGLVYPFIYTLEEGKLEEPDNYNETEVKNILANYQYQDIPEDKKVNIIAIMLEAYSDFSKFEEIEFTEDIYKNFHNIQANSISGNLITNIFGGSTITTERNFLTGYTTFSNFTKKTASYVWYFKEQGYRTEAMHPIFGAFYNRASINPNLGFDIYYNYENKFSNIQSNFVEDSIFFKSIIAGYKESKENNTPYFNFSVTYQNHVPYNSSYYEGKEYYFDNNDRLDETSYNLINQYFSGIKKTNEALKELIDYFDQEEEPVIIILFGDHNPALGDSASIYQDLGINLNKETIEGFTNYYQTPYIIHANNSAKETLNNSFIGTGNTISPIFLMNELFNNMNVQGNEYLQYMNDLKQKVDVINTYYYKEDGEFTKVENSQYTKQIEEYNNVNYYYITK